MRRFLPHLILALFCQPALAQKTPEEALKSFTVADGLQIEMFASEPMFVNPTCIDVDHKGRVWVCESVNYRCDLRKVKHNRPEGDRIVVLEDTDGDGKADKATTFYQAPDFLAPLGVAVSPNPDGKGQKVYVCHSPYIYVFEDNDGDLKADGPPKILLKGFRGIDHDHGVHGIHFGPDGKLYFSVGDQGVENLSSSNGDIKPDKGTGGQGDKGSGVVAQALAPRVWTTNHTDCQAGTIWRCNPDGTKLELIAHNFRNEYEPAVDSFGTIFTSDNDDDGNQQTRICYVMPGGNYGYHPRGKGETHWHEEQPGVVHKVLRTGFGSPTGMCWYEGELLRKALGDRPSVTGKQNEDGGQPMAPNRKPTYVYGLLLHTDAGPREVRCFVVKTKGAGYELDKINLVTSTDNWFRPSDICVAPDGSIFVSDWYDPGVGGHGMGDTTRGRIYRLTAKGQKGYKVSPLDTRTPEGAAEALSSPNLAAQNVGWRALHGMKPADSLPPLARLFKASLGTSTSSRVLWFVYSSHRGPDQVSGMFLKNVSPDGNGLMMVVTLAYDRRLAMGQLHARAMADLDEAEKLGRPVPHDYTFLGVSFSGPDSPPVGRDGLIRLRLVPAEHAIRPFYPLAKQYDGQDDFYLAAINIAVGTDPKRREIILADFEKHFPEWNDKVAKLVWELRPPQVIAKLDQKLADPKLTAAQKGFILEILAHADAQAGAKLLKLLGEPNLSPEMRSQVVSILAGQLPSRWKALQNDPAVKVTARALLQQPATQPLGVQLIAASESAELAESLVDLANDDNAGLEVRRAAIAALGQWQTDRFVIPLATLIDQRDLQRDAVTSLGRIGNPKAIALLEEILQDDKRPLTLRTLAILAVAESRAGSQRLLQLHEQKQLPQTLLADAAQVLRNSPYPDLRNKALIAFPAPGKIDLNKLPEIAKLLPRAGNAAHGRELLAVKEIGCLRCHSIRGTGGNVGPDLSMIGKKASRENLFESIIYPDKAIADQFIQHMILDRKGVTVTGLLVEETPEHVVIRDGLAKDHKFTKDDIENRGKSKKSIMPSDLLPFLSEQDLVDIVTYLETLNTPALSVDSWHILGPFDNGGGDEGLDKAFPPEKLLLDGNTRDKVIGLNVEYDGKHDKVKWKSVRPNGEGYVDLAAHFAPQNSQIVSYLWKEIESPVEQDATVLIGTDDGCKLWLNGKEVLSHRRHESATPERDAVPIKLKPGGIQYS